MKISTALILLAAVLTVSLASTRDRRAPPTYGVYDSLDNDPDRYPTADKPLDLRTHSPYPHNSGQYATNDTPVGPNRQHSLHPCAYQNCDEQVASRRSPSPPVASMGEDYGGQHATNDATIGPNRQHSLRPCAYQNCDEQVASIGEDYGGQHATNDATIGPNRQHSLHPCAYQNCDEQVASMGEDYGGQHATNDATIGPNRQQSLHPCAYQNCDEQVASRRSPSPPNVNWNDVLIGLDYILSRMKHDKKFPRGAPPSAKVNWNDVAIGLDYILSGMKHDKELPRGAPPSAISGDNKKHSPVPITTSPKATSSDVKKTTRRMTPTGEAGDQPQKGVAKDDDLPINHIANWRFDRDIYETQP